MLQHQAKSGGAVAANQADYGGQIFQFNMDIPTGTPFYRLLDRADASHSFTNNIKSVTYLPVLDSLMKELVFIFNSLLLIT